MCIRDRAKTEPKIIFSYLNQLAKAGVIDYLPKKITPYITFLEPYVHPKSFKISKENYDFLKERYIERVQSVINYVERKDKCRSRLLLEYFGETNAPDCGRCDVCHKNKLAEKAEIQNITNLIVEYLTDKKLSARELCDKLNKNEDIVNSVIRKMIDSDEIQITGERKFKLKHDK